MFNVYCENCRKLLKKEFGRIIVYFWIICIWMREYMGSRIWLFKDWEECLDLWLDINIIISWDEIIDEFIYNIIYECLLKILFYFFEC